MEGEQLALTIDDYNDRHGWPDRTCTCKRPHCGDCGDIYPCRWHLMPKAMVKPAWELPRHMIIDWENDGL